MEEEYSAAKKLYATLLRRLKRRNSKLLQDVPSFQPPIRPSSIPRLKAIIPYIQPTPRATFLTLSPTNLYTKDDPILRYLPTIKTNKPAYISWYEGTVIGDKTCSADDTIDTLFLSSGRSDALAEKVRFLRLSRGRDPLPGFSNDSPADMASLFCSVCMLFGCGIHPYGVSNVLKVTESAGCLCAKRREYSEIKDGTVSEPATLKGQSGGGQQRGAAGAETTGWHTLDEIRRWKFGSCLKECVVGEIERRLISLLSLSSPSSSTVSADDEHGISDTETRKQVKKNFDTCAGTIKLPIKKVQTRKIVMNPKKFYKPCNHAGLCGKGDCGCKSRGTFCEAPCSCMSCSFVKFCECEVCNEECACEVASRDCTEFCRCKKRINGEICENSSIFLREKRRVTVFASEKHGFGLFADEKIREGEYVMEYTGELISDKEAERRGNFYEINKCSFLFNLTYEGSECLHSIDAYSMGNESKYINHSRTKANLRAVLRVHRGQIKVVFFAVRDIYSGEELLFDYKFSEDHMLKHGIVD